MKKLSVYVLFVILFSFFLSSCAGFQHECKYREALEHINSYLAYSRHIDDLLDIIEGHALYEPGDDEFIPYYEYTKAVQDIRDIVETVSIYADSVEW